LFIEGKEDAVLLVEVQEYILDQAREQDIGCFIGGAAALGGGASKASTFASEAGVAFSFIKENTSRSSCTKGTKRSADSLVTVINSSLWEV